LSYDAGYKLQVVEFAENSSNAAAERQFGVSEKLVRDWRKMKETLLEMPRTKRARRGDVASRPKMEEALASWISECRQNGYVVTRTAIRLRAMKMSKQADYAGESSSPFHASAGWCDRFMNRQGLALRQRTKIAQKLPSDLEVKLDSFWKYAIKLRKEHDYELGQIGNMDETPMTFDLPSTRTVNAVGERTIMIKTTGHERTHFTVVLSCMADGTKLKPVVIFKRMTLPKTFRPPKGVLVKAHPKGWMDEEGTKDWLKTVWQTRPGALLNKRSMLVWDMFRAHLTDDVKKTARKNKVDLCVIPGGLTSMVQPLDVSINKPFKDRMRKQWTEWMTSGEAKCTAGGNLMKPDILLVCTWVKLAWDDIPVDIITRSFLKCGISNSLDGEEDDALFADSTAAESEGDGSDDDGIYNADGLQEFTDADYNELFGGPSDSEFEGFEQDA